MASNQDLLGRITHRLVRNHRWGSNAFVDAEILIRTISWNNTERHRAMNEVLPEIKRGRVSFLSCKMDGNRAVIKIRGNAHDEVAYFLKDCGYDEMQIEPYLSSHFQGFQQVPRSSVTYSHPFL